MPTTGDRDDGRTDATVVASFNLHAGVDGWGRPFDVLGAAHRLAADVLVLQECFSPDGGPAHTATIADALGYRVIEVTLHRGRILDPAGSSATKSSWGPRPW